LAFSCNLLIMLSSLLRHRYTARIFSYFIVLTVTSVEFLRIFNKNNLTAFICCVLKRKLKITGNLLHACSSKLQHDVNENHFHRQNSISLLCDYNIVSCRWTLSDAYFPSNVVLKFHYQFPLYLPINFHNYTELYKARNDKD
jgi:hypothetical protein